ncbi:protein kinase domain-containing protein [Acinetobacter baretiae]|nr:protein kinase [Acinetobacter baretiae]
MQAYHRQSSEQYGRKLYQVVQQGQVYWLKYQKLNDVKICSQIHIDGWKRECHFYNIHKNEPFVIPHQVIDLKDLNNMEDEGYGLIFPHKKNYFQSISRNIDEIQQSIKALCELLFELHLLDYVHGDIKKQHFLMDEDHIYMIDFEHSFNIYTPLSGIHATPRYMAPELFHGVSKSAESDFYALGVVIYEWLTEQKLSASSYQDWAVIHCQHYFYTLPMKYEPLQPILDCLLEKSLFKRKEKLKQLKSILNQQIAMNHED